MRGSMAALSLIFLLALTLLGIDPTGAVEQQNPDPSVQAQDFELFTSCQPVSLVVESLGTDAEKIVLTRTDIINAVESRLRAARIYTDKSLQPYISIAVNVVGQAFSIDFQLHKALYDRGIGLAGLAPTWSKVLTGTHGNRGYESGSYILSLLSRLLDEFLAEYLRVNEKACEP